MPQPAAVFFGASLAVRHFLTLVSACVPCLFCVVCSAGGGAGGQVAKDALGNDIKESAWLKTHPVGDRSLSQGLKVGALRIPFGQQAARQQARGRGWHARPRAGDGEI